MDEGLTDPMLSELYKRFFETEREAEIVGQDDTSKKKRQIALAKHWLLSELIGIRTRQIRWHLTMSEVQ